jgi:phage-related minor tail protein
MADTVTVAVQADTSGFDRALTDLQSKSDQFGRVLTNALKGAVDSGKSLDDVLRQIGTNLATMALSSALSPLQGLASSLFSGLLGNIGGVMPFADGGVVRSPTYFAAGGSLGLMGEAGAEAILPLARGSDGRLGVAGPGGGRSMQVVFNVSTPDPSSFKKSEAQVTAMLARAVQRGARTL